MWKRPLQVISLLSLMVSSADALTLEETLQSAFQKNETVAQSRQQVVQVEEQISQAKGLVYPSLSLEGSHLIQPKPSDPVAAQFFPERQTTVNFALVQPLFRGGREFAAIRQRNNLLEAQKQAQTQNLIKVYVDVSSAYLDVLAAEQDLKNLNEQREIYADRVKKLQTRSRRGESSATEVLTAQSTAAALDAEAQLVQSRLTSARENLAVLSGVPVDAPLVDKQGETTDIKLRPLEDYLARIEESPEVKSVKEQLEASDEEVSIAKGGHWPTADLLGNYYLERPDGFTKDLKWDIQFKVSIPLFEGGLRSAQVREAVSKKSVADLELARLRRSKEAEMRSLYQNVRLRADQLSALKKSAELAEKNYKTVLRDSHYGLSRNIDVQMALTDYRSIRRTYDQTRFQARLDLIKLESSALYLPAVVTKEM
ncbi:TolC family protein [Pseudobdellovibrio exovorus]|uniref:Uncharacterized protein n=1 Tax=Pseudobdellovibrio exovorus JSS TaxID=1184267 RepID=M4V5E0_9BACT|nr:TolC family protein [Pseudobdellovibrio exovorus]AGH94547.1 hypothetical protein A11Q_327 [Pseudobdellovibrio exovorus JSS]